MSISARSFVAILEYFLPEIIWCNISFDCLVVSYSIPPNFIAAWAELMIIVAYWDGSTSSVNGVSAQPNYSSQIHFVVQYMRAYSTAYPSVRWEYGDRIALIYWLDCALNDRKPNRIDEDALTSSFSGSKLFGRVYLTRWRSLYFTIGSLYCSNMTWISVYITATSPRVGKLSWR